LDRQIGRQNIRAELIYIKAVKPSHRTLQFSISHGAIKGRSARVTHLGMEE
jgi:hypothetical protein